MEAEISQQPLLTEQAVQYIIKQARHYRVPLLASLFWGLLAHMFAFTNKLVNHDEVAGLLNKGMTLSSGRWGLDVLSYIFPDVSMPWIYGIISLLLLGTAVCMMVRIFSIRRRLFQILLAGLVVTFPSQTGTFTYMFTASAYAAAFFLAVAAVWLLGRKGWHYRLLALGCMVFSLSIYQSYVAVTAGLLILVLIRQLLTECQPGPVIKKGFLFVGFLALSLGIYYGATQLLLRLQRMELNGYAAANISFQLSDILQNAGRAYEAFRDFFKSNTHGIIPGVGALAAHWVCAGAGCFLLLLWSWEKRKQPLTVLLWGLLGLIPLAVNCMFLFTTPASIHTLVLYGFVAVYILILLTAQFCRPSADVCRRLAMELISLALGFIIISNTYVSNQVYLNLYLKYENAYSFYTSLYADLKMTPGYTRDTKIALLGDYFVPAYYAREFPEALRIQGAEGFLPTDYSYSYFLGYYLGVYITVPTEAETAVILQSPEYRQMPVYPAYGSIRTIGDIIVVKLSE